jgi:hypothetical protein
MARKKKLKLNKSIINGIPVVNLLDHEVVIYKGDQPVLTIEKSGVEARIAYKEAPAFLLGGTIPVTRRLGNDLVFYDQNSKIVPYGEMVTEIGDAISIVSSICLKKATLFLGKAVSPGTKISINGNDKVNGRRVIGTKNFITE